MLSGIVMPDAELAAPNHPRRFDREPHETRYLANMQCRQVRKTPPHAVKLAAWDALKPGG